VAVIDYGEESTINLNCDSNYLSAESSRALLDAYGEQLNASLSAGAETQSGESDSDE
jgi:hypothetical protein